MKQGNKFARRSAVVSIITFVGHLLSTGLKLLISRNYGLLGFGQYALVMAFSRFFSTLIQMGYHQSIVYFISKFRFNDEWSNLSRFFHAGLRHLVATSLALFIVLFVFKDLFFEYIHSDSGGVFTLLAISLISASIAVNNFLSGTLRSLKLFREQALLFTSSFPGLMIIAVLTLIMVETETQTIHQFLFLGISLNLILLVIVFLLTRRLFSSNSPDKNESVNISELPKYSLPIWLSSVMQSAARSSDRILLGVLSSISQVAIYGAGFTVSILFAFPLKAMGPVFQPYIVEYYTNKDFASINKLYNTMVRWSALFVIPAFGGLLCFGDQLILIFGDGFGDAYPVMIVLSFAQMVSTIAGLAGTLLNMTEKQADHAWINSYGFVIAIGLNVLLIPRFGAMGAAIGTGVTILITNVFRVRKLMKYYSVKTDYMTLLWLLAKFLPLVALTYWFIYHNSVNWILLVVLFSLTSLGIIYFSLLKTERESIITYIRKLN